MSALERREAAFRELDRAVWRLYGAATVVVDSTTANLEHLRTLVHMAREAEGAYQRANDVAIPETVL